MEYTVLQFQKTAEPMNNLKDIDEILTKSKTVAVVGMSDKSSRASHHIGKYLATQGYRVIPVNPALSEVLGIACYPDLDTAEAAVRAETGKGIDLVDVFRASEFVAALVDEAIRLKIPYLWLQDGVIDAESVARARTAGIKCVEDDCIYRQHATRPSV
jgi:predicted CoA-binding protein